MYPLAGPAFNHLSPLLHRLTRIDYSLRVENPNVNQGQMASNMDERLQATLNDLGATQSQLTLPVEIPQELDFAFAFAGHTVAVEIEKTNKEKILRDLLKCHMYLHFGADFALVVLPKNYPHKQGVWDLFEFGVQRYKECVTYGFGSEERLGRILILGFTQFDSGTCERLSTATRMRMRKEAAAHAG